QMVIDTPIAFLETPEQVRALDETEWRSRIARSRSDGNTRVVAVAPDGTWVGSMSAFLSDGDPPYVIDPRPGARRANLVGVFIDPDWRGDAGVADALLSEIAEWARGEHLSELYLHVGEANVRARRYYQKRGFQETGVVAAIPEQPGVGEIEMVRAL
ncbi:MAG: GNAT family N-acetyltransferase, partial [Pseudolysinimonas sp.]